MTRAKQTLREHSQLTHHRNALEDAAVFLRQQEEGQLSVEQQMQSQAARTIERNRKILGSILKCIVFCGKQNIPLRGYRNESATIQDGLLCDLSGNPGNFQALLQFRMEAGDEVLQQHFSTADKNAQYRSPRIQNDLIGACCQWIQQRIIADVKKSKFFSVCADEAADASNKEQLPLVLRFVDTSGAIREELIEFVLCDTGTTGEAIAGKILASLDKLGLDCTNLRGQGYDGAGSMAGRIQGTAARILEQCPSAYYMHCGAHALNLCVVNACGTQAVRNMHGTLEEVCLFFQYSPKRQQFLEENIKKLEDVSHTKLINLCKTRWVARIAAYESFAELLPAVIAVFEEITTGQGWNVESTRKANSLLAAIRKFPFIHAFVVTKHGLAFVKGLTTSLQGRAQDIVRAYGEVSAVTKAVEKARSTVGTVHKKWYSEAVALADSIDADEPALPRNCRRQQNRANIPAENPEEHFRRATAIPFLDILVSQLQERFSNVQQKAMAAMTIVPSALDDHASSDKVEDMVKVYGRDLPVPAFLAEELLVWKQKWDGVEETDRPLTLTDALKHADKLLFPNIHCLLRIMCTLPVTSCECERSISVLRRLKTYMRSTIGEERLTGLALLHTKYLLEINISEVLNIFAAQHPRRMLL